MKKIKYQQITIWENSKDIKNKTAYLIKTKNDIKLIRALILKNKEFTVDKNLSGLCGLTSLDSDEGAGTLIKVGNSKYFLPKEGNESVESLNIHLDLMLESLFLQNDLKINTIFLGTHNERKKGEIIMNEVRLKELHGRLMKVQEFAFDTETSGLRVQWIGKDTLVGLSICFGENHNYYIPIRHRFDKGQLSEDTIIKYIKPIFERINVRIIGHNLKFDLHVITNLGINIQTEDLFDTMVASFAIDENEQKGLKHLTNLVYKVNQTKFDSCLSSITGEQKKMCGFTGNKKPPFYLCKILVGAPYAIADSYWTWRHYVDWIMELLEKENVEKIYYRTLIPFLKTLFKMERRGAKIDIERLREMSQRASKDLEELEEQIYYYAGVAFKVTSSQQLAELLFGYLKFNKKGEYTGNKHLVDASFMFPAPQLTDKGAPATSEGALKAVLKYQYKKDTRKLEGQKLIKLVLKYKKLEKLRNTFMTGLINLSYEDGKVHPTFNLGGASSGRLSCSEPNLQQLPRPIELEEPKSMDVWGEENNLSKKELKELKTYSNIIEKNLGYPTGKSLTSSKKLKGHITSYLNYLKEWRTKNENSVFWKSYEIRDCFIPTDRENTSLIALDFSNLEMRLLAHFSLDPNLVDTFENDHDAHGSTAVNMFSLDCSPDEAKKKYKPLRQIAKTLNFMLMYGGSYNTLYDKLSEEDAEDENGDPITKEKAKEYYDKYFIAYDGVKDFIKNQKKYAHKHEFIYTLIGRKRRLPEINTGNRAMQAYEERLSVNACIQGSGADIMMLVQPKVEADERLKELNCNMILQVHDELVFECPDEHIDEAIKIIKEYMEHPLPKPLNIPLRADADSGKSYAEAK